MANEPTIPPVDLPAAATTLLAGFGAPSATAQSMLYRALANQPEMLVGWIEFAWRLRVRAVTSRRLRELVILRAVEMANCDFEIHAHRSFAREAGASDEVIAELRHWRKSAIFTPAERAALDFTEAMVAGSVADGVNDELARHFDPAERVELILTAGMYVMVPRVLDALRLSKPA